MKRLLLSVALLPLITFGDWYDPDFVVSIYCYKYNTSGTLTTPITSEVTAYRIPLSSVEDWYFSHSFGVSYGSSGSLNFPTVLSANGSMTNSTKSMYFSLQSTNGVWYSLVRLAPSVVTYASYVANFVRLGYSGSGISNLYTNSTGMVSFNCTPSIVFSDVLTSTNTVFRRALLEGLSSLSTSVQNVNVDLGQFQRDYSFVNSSHFDVSNVIDVAESNSIIPSRVATSLKSMARNPFNYEYINSVLDSYRRAQWLPLAFSDSDLASPLHNDTRVKQGLKNLGDSFGAGASYHYTTPLTNELQKLNTNWVSQAKAALADNTQQITNQLAHMFDDTPNGIGRVMRDTANNTFSSANAAGSIDERLQRGITVAVVNEGNTSVGVHLDGPVNIDSTQWQTLSIPLGSVSSLLDSLYGDFSTFYGFGNSNYDWSHFFDLVQSFKSQNHIDLTALASHSVTGDVSRIYDYLSGYQSNILYEIATSITNSWDDYYFTRFRRANEFIDESETAFSISVASDEVFGNGFDEQEFANLNWFSRVELLLYQLQKANDTTNVLESADLEGEFDDSVQRFNLAGTNFVAASGRVVNLFGFISRFADSVKLAFQSSASPVTDGVLLMEGGSWLVNEPLILRVPIAVQNALRLVFQCIWYLSAFVIGWRIVVVTWDKVVTLVRWLWSVFDV